MMIGAGSQIFDLVRARTLKDLTIIFRSTVPPQLEYDATLAFTVLELNPGIHPQSGNSRGNLRILKLHSVCVAASGAHK